MRLEEIRQQGRNEFVLIAVTKTVSRHWTLDSWPATPAQHPTVSSTRIMKQR